MAPRPWSDGTSRDEWLHSRGAAYREAVHTKTRVTFLEKIYHDWFEKYHWSLDNKTEPDPAIIHVEPVLESEILVKNKTIVLKKEVFWVYLCLNASIFLNWGYVQSIARWFSSRYDDTGNAKPRASAVSPFLSAAGTNLIASMKAKLSNKPKPRLAQIEHVYSSMYFATKVKPHVAARWERDKNQMGPKNKPFSPVSSSQALTKEMWEKESPDVRKLVEDERQRRFKEAVASFERENSDLPRTPEQFQK
jgi:hypothetical protein